MAQGRTMTVFAGKPVSEGVAIGRVQLYRKSVSAVTRSKVGDVEAELARFEQAKENAKKEIAKIHEKALEELGEAGAEIFEAHRMLLDDLNFVDAVTEQIELERVNAEAAVEATCEKFSAMFEAMDNEYMRARAADVRDIGGRVIAKLLELGQTAPAGDCGAADAGPAKERTAADSGSAAAAGIWAAPESAGPTTTGSAEPVILVADDLTPSETVQLDKSRILAIVTRDSSVNSHTAILARTMGLPALTAVEAGAGVESDEAVELDGHMGIVDGYEGLLLVDPGEETLERYRARQKEENEKLRILAELRDKETVTRDGRRIRLCANIGSVEDAEAARQEGAEGVGLFRTEFLYLGAKDFPTEEEQFDAYRAVAEKMAGKKVVIRTLDVGADKRADYFALPDEANPALGYRGIRYCLDHTDIFRTQLRAIFRAACYGSVAVMYPMIVSEEEVRRAKRIAEEVKAELDGQNIPRGEIEQGVMIETPAAVWISEELAKEADFFSIGTNDLTQYMLAIDRQNARLDAFCDPHHPAVLGAVRTVVENAHKCGIRAGICGELAADTALTEEFLRMGVDELSLNPARILPIRAAVLGCGALE